MGIAQQMLRNETNLNFILEFAQLGRGDANQTCDILEWKFSQKLWIVNPLVTSLYLIIPISQKDAYLFCCCLSCSLRLFEGNINCIVNLVSISP